jgi:hypothetical protein
VRTTSFSSSEAVERNVAVDLKLTARFRPTQIYVDGNDISALRINQIDEYDETLKADQVVTNVVRTDFGLTMTRRVMAFSQQYHDNYLIYEYTYENTGNTDADDEIELPGQRLENVVMGGMVHYTTCREAAIRLSMGRISWGANQWQSKRGEDYADYLAGDTNADSLRLAFSYLGQDKDETFNTIGGPWPEGDGRLTGAQHTGIGFLHIDTDGNNKEDDPNQPSTIGWNGNDNFIGLTVPEESTMRQGYDMIMGDMILGNTDRMDDRRKGFDNPEGNETYPNRLTDAGGACTVIGYGPFTLEFGESIRIVEVHAVAGLSREMCKSVGKTWNEGVSPYTLPDGSTTDDEVIYKNAWVFTGRDSLFQTIGRARRNLALEYDIPQPPQPPAIFNVESLGDRIALSWTPPAGAEEAADFGGYRIYRAVEKTDTTYEEIFACGVGTENPTIVNHYNDMSAVRGFPYYYYIVAFNDGSNNQTGANPRGSLHSNRFYTQTTEPAFLRRQAGSSLDGIRIVPNPFNIKARQIQYGAGDLKDRIMFLDIPAYCSIKIYTERGDLVKTIDHADGSGDESWNSITSSRQVVVSGVYLAYIEVTQDYHDPVTDELLYKKGDSTVEKFVIIR